MHINISMSSILVEMLVKRLDEDKNVRIGTLVTKAFKYAKENKLTHAIIKPEYRDSSCYRPYHITPINKIYIDKCVKTLKLIQPDVTVSSVALGLLVAVATDGLKCKKEEKTQSADSIVEKTKVWLGNIGLGERAEQQNMIKNCVNALQSKPDPIVFCEASVGVGKTHVKAVLAINHALNNKAKGISGSVVITTPTYQVASQITDAVSSLIKNNDLDITYAMIKSRSEYISVELVTEYIKENRKVLPESMFSAIQALLDKGEYYRALYENEGLDCAPLTLTRHAAADDPAEIIYQSDRNRYSAENIVICTHAFLACHVASIHSRLSKQLGFIQGNLSERLKKQKALLEKEKSLITDARLLPMIDLLIIDEIHQLNDNYQMLKNRNLSMGMLVASVKKILSKADARLFEGAVNSFVEKASMEAAANGDYPSSLTQTLRNDFEQFMPKIKAKKRTIEKIHLLELLDQLVDMCNSATSKHSVYLSPVRGKVSIKLNGVAPANWLALTWLLTPKAVCVSGTLSSQSVQNIYQQAAVHAYVDINRLYSLSPIESPWLRDNVSVFIPQLSLNQNEAINKFEGTAFYPAAKSKNVEPFKKWIDLQANYICQALSNAAGGTIITCTSYEQIELLENALIDKLPSLNDCHLMRSTKGRSIVSQVREYKEFYLHGRRPIWLAVSSIGTGVDITDYQKKADLDNMVSQLIVTRIPISSDNKKKYLESVSDAFILFRQIIGRLVRRPGRKNMELHILDARCSIKTGQYKRFYVLMSNYKDIRELPLSE